MVWRASHITLSSDRNKKQVSIEKLAGRVVKSVENHVIVVGYKFLGKYVVESLQRLKVDFVVITRNKDQLDILKSNKIPGFYAPITRIHEALKEANVETASALVSTMETDGENMLAVLSAKQLNKKIKTISIANDKDLVKGVKNAGADFVIPYFDIMGHMLATSSISKEISGVFFSEDLKSKFVAEFRIEVSGLTCKDIRGICPLLMISRNAETIYDMKDDFQLKEGDLVYVLTDQICIEAFRDKLYSLSRRRA
jgi:voltage-gated potassium channel Kch